MPATTMPPTTRRRRYAPDVVYPGSRASARLLWPLLVYLPQAVAWPRAATGINDPPQVLADLDGDGQLEILHANFVTLTATDLRRDRDVWRLSAAAEILVVLAEAALASGDLDGAMRLCGAARLQDRAHPRVQLVADRVAE